MSFNTRAPRGLLGLGAPGSLLGQAAHDGQQSQNSHRTKTLGNELAAAARRARMPPSAFSLYNARVAPLTSPKRRVFFSFHYQSDINRVNVVRNSWRIRPEDGTQPANWFDNSVWETAKKTGTAALKKLIHEGMSNTSVTCVLAGASTWGRPWVRYEIAYALSRGNGLLTVYVDGVNCMISGIGTRGRNPLDYLGLKWNDDGRAFIWENFDGKWRRYKLYNDAVTWPRWLPNVTASKFIMPLSRGALAYDYARQDGYGNLSEWTQLAAQQTRRS